MASWLMAVDRVGRHTGSWCYIQGSTRNHGNEGKTNNLGWMLYSVYAVLSVCCTRCMLYSVYAVLGVCCTRCMLYSVYAVLGVCCTLGMLYSVYAVLRVCCTQCILYSMYAVLGVCCSQCILYSMYVVLGVCCTQCQLLIMAWRDREGWLNFVFCDDDRVVNEEERWWIKMGMMWRIRADRRIQRYDFPDWVGKISNRCNDTPDRNIYLPYRGWYIDSHMKFSKSQFLMVICPISSDLSPSRHQIYRHLRTRS